VALAFTLEYLVTAFAFHPRRAYLLGWRGVIDLLAIVPFYLDFFHVGAAAAGMLTILRELRLLRVLRTLKLVKVAHATAADRHDLWLPLTIFVTVTATGWMVDGTLRRAEPAAWAATARQVSWAVFSAGSWMSAAFGVNRAARVFLWDGLVARAIGGAVPALIRNTAEALVYAGAGLAVLSLVLHWPLTGMWAAAGAFSVVVGLALRNVILDLFVGFALSIDRSFKIGDYVQIQQNNQIGRVVEINWRTTHLETLEKNILIVPNSRIGEMMVTNFSSPQPVATFDVTVWVDDAVPVEAAERAIVAGVEATWGKSGVVAGVPPRVFVRSVTPQGVEYWIRFSVDMAVWTVFGAKTVVYKSVLEHLRAAGMAPANTLNEVLYAPLVSDSAASAGDPAVAARLAVADAAAAHRTSWKRWPGRSRTGSSRPIHRSSGPAPSSAPPRPQRFLAASRKASAASWPRLRPQPLWARSSRAPHCGYWGMP
jgi:small-conductance mechanosensitive channel